MTRLLAFLAILPACSWVPPAFPADVVVRGPVTQDEQSAAIDGAEAWSRAIETDVFDVTFGDSTRCGRIEITFTAAQLAPNEMGKTFHQHCRTVIHIRPGRSVAIMRIDVAHELGHAVMGSAHNPDPRSVMYVHDREDEVITLDDVYRFQDAMERR